MAVCQTWCMTNNAQDQAVLTQVQCSTGIIELNRPKALNSLNLEMVDAIAAVLDRWDDDESIHRILIRSTSPKAFCAGGDVRASRDAGLAGHIDEADQFFVTEYEMNEFISLMSKPYIAVLDGIVMGGGLGLSLHASHRVVTEKVMAAMPEMAIGFATDCGISWESQRIRLADGGDGTAFARFIGITGWRLGAADMMFTGWGTDFVPHDVIEEFQQMLITESLDEALDKFGADPADVEGTEPSWLEAHREAIESCFHHDTWAEMSAAIDACPDEEFVAKVRELLVGANPTSVVATAELCAATHGLPTAREGLDTEMALGNVLRREPNFAEGVRAVLVDKDRDPHFDPSEYAAVDPQPYREVVRKAAGQQS